MLRTTVIRSNFLKKTAQKILRNNVTRVIAVECSKRKYHNRKVSILGVQAQQWRDQVLRNYSSDLPAHTKVALPALSPTMETGNIVSWEKKEGDKLNEGDLLAEIETDKATMGFETPEEGYLAKILVPAGTKGVPIGKLVCIIVQDQAHVAAFKDFKDDTPAGAKPAKPAAPAPPKAAPPARAPSPPPRAASPPPAAASSDRVYASPMAKRLAEERQIRLQGKGSGLYDSITSIDLDKLAGAAPAKGAAAPSKKAPAGPKAPSYPAGAVYIDIPVTNIREVIGKRLIQSKHTAPHYYVSSEVIADNILKVREKYNKRLEKKKIKLSVNDFIVKAAAMACIKVPEVNSAWMDTVIRQYKHADVSIAVATDKGLITPIVFEADRKGVIEISQTIKALVAKARENKLQPHEFQGGTFCVSNLGMYGVAYFTSIINLPQSCILAVGTTRSRLVEDEDSEKGFRKEQFLTVTISSDHRVVDGALAARWLQAFREHIEEPESMII